MPSIVATGCESGFTACGVASCAPSEHGDHLDRWLAMGAEGSMAWMASTAAIRKNLQGKWDWARTALVGVVSYLQEPVERSRAPGLWRHVARYARGRDYHHVVKARLEAWAQALAADAGEPFRHAALVDTSAILERELAMRAGLGWIGKNTCLIGSEGDSWRFIGVLLVDFDVDLEPAPRLAERCGTCRACLDACPTQAFPEPHVLDARRCISYLTIEHRGPIDPELRPLLDGWLFGCDVCQEVCPWNRRLAPAHDPDLAPDARLAALDLVALAGLPEPTLREAVRGTPLLRAKRAGLIRNALLAAASVGEERIRGVASSLADDPDDGIRDAARWALARLGAVD